MDKKSMRREERREEFLKRKKRKKVVCYSVAAVIILIAVTLFTIWFCLKNSKISQLCNYSWVCSSAENASGDEVELSEIYRTNSTSYQGSLTFNDDGTFSLWLTPGSPDDGTHSGKYKFSSDSELDITFDEGTHTSFKLIYNNNIISNIIVKYQDYDITFKKQ